MATYTVSNTPDLIARMKSVANGDTIKLNDGNYSSGSSTTTISKSNVKIEPVNRDNPPVFTSSLTFNNITGFTFDGLWFKSTNLSGGYPTGKGLTLYQCNNINIKNCLFSGYRIQLDTKDMRDFDVGYCEFTNCSMDFIRLYSTQIRIKVHNCIIHNNNFDPTTVGNTGNHADCIQLAHDGSGSTHDDIEIYENQLYSTKLGSTPYPQGIYAGNGAYRNNKIASNMVNNYHFHHNYIQIGHVNGMGLDAAKDFVIEYNLFRRRPNDSASMNNPKPTILNKSIGIFRYNVMPLKLNTESWEANDWSQVTQTGNVTSTTAEPPGWVMPDVGPYADTTTPTTPGRGLLADEWGMGDPQQDLAYSDPDMFAGVFVIKPGCPAYGCYDMQWKDGTYTDQPMAPATPPINGANMERWVMQAAPGDPDSHVTTTGGTRTGLYCRYQVTNGGPWSEWSQTSYSFTVPGTVPTPRALVSPQDWGMGDPQKEAAYTNPDKWCGVFVYLPGSPAYDAADMQWKDNTYTDQPMVPANQWLNGANMQRWAMRADPGTPNSHVNVAGTTRTGLRTRYLPSIGGVWSEWSDALSYTVPYVTPPVVIPPGLLVSEWGVGNPQQEPAYTNPDKWSGVFLIPTDSPAFTAVEFQWQDGTYTNQPLVPAAQQTSADGSLRLAMSDTLTTVGIHVDVAGTTRSNLRIRYRMATTGENSEWSEWSVNAQSYTTPTPLVTPAGLAASEWGMGDPQLESTGPNMWAGVFVFPTNSPAYNAVDMQWKDATYTDQPMRHADKWMNAANMRRWSMLAGVGNTGSNVDPADTTRSALQVRFKLEAGGPWSEWSLTTYSYDTPSSPPVTPPVDPPDPPVTPPTDPPVDPPGDPNPPTDPDNPVVIREPGTGIKFQRMVAATVNEPRNLHHAKGFDVRLPKIGESKRYVDRHYTGVGGNYLPAIVATGSMTISGTATPLAVGSTISSDTLSTAVTPGSAEVRYTLERQKAGESLWFAVDHDLTAGDYTVVADDIDCLFRHTCVMTADGYSTIVLFSNYLQVGDTLPVAITGMPGIVGDTSPLYPGGTITLNSFPSAFDPAGAAASYKLQKSLVGADTWSDITHNIVSTPYSTQLADSGYKFRVRCTATYSGYITATVDSTALAVEDAIAVTIDGQIVISGSSTPMYPGFAISISEFPSYTPEVADLFERAGQSILFGAWPDDNNTISDFETYLEAPADLISHHPDATSGWAGMAANIAARGAAVTYDAQMHWSIPFMLRTGNTLAAAAAGDYDADHVTIANAILSAHNRADGPIIVRGCWEFNLSSQPWYCANTTDDANFIAAWIRWVNNFRSVSNRFLFEWCPNSPGGTNRDVALQYPGDDYVDLIGMDIYNHEPTNAGYFGYQRDDANAGITYIHSLAVAHGKPFTMPEFGFTGTSGAAYLTYPADLMAIMRTYDVLYGLYWNSDLAYDGVLSDGSKPEIAALVKAEFGDPAITSSATGSVNGDGTTAFSLSLTASHEGTWELTNNADGFTLSGATLQLAAQTYASDNTRTVTINFVDTRGLTTYQHFTLTVTEAVTDLYPSDYAVMSPAEDFYKVSSGIVETAADFLALAGVSFNVDPVAGFSASGYTPPSDGDLKIALPAGGRFSVYLTIDTPAHQSGVYQTPVMLHSTAYPGGTNIECALDGFDSSSPFNLGRAVRVNGSTIVNSTWTTIATGQTNKIGIVVDGAGVRFFKNGVKVNTVADTSFDTAYTLDRLNIGMQQNGSADFNALIRLVRVKTSADDDATAQGITT